MKINLVEGKTQNKYMTNKCSLTHTKDEVSKSLELLHKLRKHETPKSGYQIYYRNTATYELVEKNDKKESSRERCCESRLQGDAGKIALDKGV